MAIIQAAHYRETEARLAADPIVIAMAKGLADVPRAKLVHEGPDGGPRFEFMQRANAEYRERGGTDGGHIGAVATALLMVLDSGAVKPTKVVTFLASRDNQARTDEDRAMGHVSIYSGDDEAQARAALTNYMVNEEAASLAKYRRDGREDWVTNRMAAIFDALQQLVFAKFEGGKPREALSFDADGIQFQLVRTEKEAR